MHDLFVDRNAQVAGVFFVTQKCALRAVMLDARGCELINFAGGDARLNEIGDFIQDFASDDARRPHGLEIAFVFNAHLTAAPPRQKRPLILPRFRKPS